MRTYTGDITKLETHQIFVFGSNTQGRHGKGAAHWALLHAGAIYGQASGRQGQSYAIITKDLTKKEQPSISTIDIVKQIMRLYEYACNNPDLEFIIPYKASSANLNGYSPDTMARLFAFARMIPDNISFEINFALLVQKEIAYISADNKDKNPEQQYVANIVDRAIGKVNGKLN